MKYTPLLAFLLAAAPQDPTNAILIERLGHDSVEVREAATTDLIARGRPALPEIRDVAARSTDPEILARARAIVAAVASVRWRSDLDAARQEATESGKPLFVYSTMGPQDGLL